MAGAVGVAACALLGFAGLPREPRRGARPDGAAARAPVQISLDEALAPSAAARPPVLLEPVRAPASRRPARAPVPSRVAARAAAPPSAPAANLVARAPSPSAPVDMTDETFVVGSAKEYGGGVTASGATSTGPGWGRGTDAGRTSAGAAGGDGPAAAGRSAPVGLATQNWSCPWPSEAEPLLIDEEMVVIRVVVRPDGTAESVVVISDPGHGFGRAAASCAMRTLFTPARAAGGEPIRATSAPIRVRFTRQ